MSSFTIAEPSSDPLVPSSRLISELAQAQSKLRTTTERSDSALIVHAGGELDACNEVTWRRLLNEAATAATPPGPLVVDTSELDFMACCAYAVLAEAAKRCWGRGVELRLVSRQPAVGRIVGACGLSRLLPVDRSVEAALAGSTPADW
jgi:anti-anti-sigma factor